MDDLNLAAERRKQLRLEKLGTNEPRCGVCGESDWRCIEQHHTAGQKNAPETVNLCANDHRRVTDPQKDHPAASPGADTLLLTAGEFMLGLHDMLKIILDKLYELGNALIERANSTAHPEMGGVA